MSKINDGTQPAFGGSVYPGMSLRDYLAAQALVAMGPHVPSHFTDGQPVKAPCLDHPDATTARAEWAYQQADAMLDERPVWAQNLPAFDVHLLRHLKSMVAAFQGSVVSAAQAAAIDGANAAIAKAEGR